MRKKISIEETGKTVEEAIDKACKQLGLKREDCSFEIIDRPRKRLFGLRFTPAKVRVSIEVPDGMDEEEPVATPSRPDKVASPQKQDTTPKKAPEQKAPETKAPETKAPETKAPEREKTSAPRTAAPAEKNGISPVIPAPIAREKSVVPTKDRRPVVTATPDVPLEANPEKIIVATQFVKDIVGGMGVEAAMTVRDVEDGIFIAIAGNDLGTIIGRRGETLDAIQYLTGLVTNRLEGEYLRVTVDSGDYRLKREQTLVDLAERLSEQVLKTNVSKTLEPMSASERRVIHATVAEIEGVSSHSVGSDPGRRVVIKSPTSTSRGPRRNDVRRSNGSSPRPTRQDSTPRTEPNPISREPEVVTPPSSPSSPPSAPQEKRVDTVVKETPLYGKVDLD